MRIISRVSAFWLSTFLALNVTGLKWSPTPTDGEVLYACAHSEVTIAWNYAVQEGDIISTAWNFHSRSQELVAMYSQGNFIPQPSFSERVRFVPNAGITLSHLRTEDAGTYSVTVIGHDASGAGIEIHRSVFLQVSEALMTTDHELHADQATAEFYNVTQQYHAVLTCGQFTFSADPPISVEWLTPKGEILASTVYSNGFFKLYIPNPVTSGNYTCRISAASVNRSCSQGQGQEASVEVSGVMTRLVLMEARLAEKDAIVDQLKSTQNQLQADLQALKEHASPAIAFSARLLPSLTVNDSYYVLALSDVLLNQGSAYNSRTGKFTAPVSGVYYFSAFLTTGVWHHALMRLRSTSGVYFASWADSTQLYQTASLQGAVHLNRGEQVWLEPDSTSFLLGRLLTAFSGFILSVD